MSNFTVDFGSEKQRLRDQLDSQVRDYLARGGSIHVLENDHKLARGEQDRRTAWTGLTDITSLLE